MDEHQIELTRAIFATMTASLEDVIEFAVAGQSIDLTDPQRVECARRLEKFAANLGALAQAVMVIAKPNS